MNGLTLVNIPSRSRRSQTPKGNKATTKVRKKATFSQQKLAADLFKEAKKFKKTSHPFIHFSRRKSQKVSIFVVVAVVQLQQTSTWHSSGEPIGVEVLLDTTRQGELDLRIVELFDVWTTTFGRGHLLHANDLNGIGAGTMTRSHVTV